MEKEESSEKQEKQRDENVCVCLTFYLFVLI